MNRLLIVSIDSHAAASAESYLPYMEKSFRDECYTQLLEDDRRFFAAGQSLSLLRPDLVAQIDDRDAIRSGGGRGSWDISCRIAEMDAEGVAVEILFPGTHTGMSPFHEITSPPCSPAYRDAGARSYNRWLADHIGEEGKGRVFGIAYPGSARNLDELIKEMVWAKENGFLGINCPGHVADRELKPFYDRHWDRFWAAATDLDLVITIHAGFRVEQGPFLEFCEGITHYLQSQNIVPIGRPGDIGTEVLDQIGGFDTFADQTLGPMQAIWEMMLGGVFDRYPRLKIVPTEIHVDWIPPFLAELDRRFLAGEMAMKRKPSEYWRDNFFAGATNIRPAEVALRHEIGIDKVMFGRDYPHPESCWPNTWDWLSVALRDVPENEVRMILGENAIECYNLDKAFLTTVAERIGPEVNSILGDRKVSDSYIQNFAERGRFLNPPYALDPAWMKKALDEDIQNHKLLVADFMD